ncbi:hypothetical protein [Methylibium sp.]|uniref:hypothetical protein n=1 Tax=Methylibium sp. TaxID=2067992 RepID=UPI001803DC4E|nr:hypothetical protein [Methylibium sp.]MBA3588491.1 hypothetical protein [Methylibium sp.]
MTTTTDPRLAALDWRIAQRRLARADTARNRASALRCTLRLALVATGEIADPVERDRALRDMVGAIADGHTLSGLYSGVTTRRSFSLGGDHRTPRRVDRIMDRVTAALIAAR